MKNVFVLRPSSGSSERRVIIYINCYYYYYTYSLLSDLINIKLNTPPPKKAYLRTVEKYYIYIKPATYSSSSPEEDQIIPVILSRTVSKVTKAKKT